MKDFLKLIFFGVTKASGVRMFNPDTGEKKEMAVGFNLQILLLGSFFGLPLFFKGLWKWAWGLFLLSTVQFAFFYSHVRQVLSARTVAEYEEAMRRTADPVESVLSCLLIAGVLLLSVKGNRWAVEQLLEKGWRFENPEEPLVKQTIKKWKISKHYLKPFRNKETL